MRLWIYKSFCLVVLGIVGCSDNRLQDAVVRYEQNVGDLERLVDERERLIQEAKETVEAGEDAMAMIAAGKDASQTAEARAIIDRTNDKVRLGLLAELVICDREIARQQKEVDQSKAVLDSLR